MFRNVETQTIKTIKDEVFLERIGGSHKVPTGHANLAKTRSVTQLLQLCKFHLGT